MDYDYLCILILALEALFEKHGMHEKDTELYNLFWSCVI